jgi:hypothetical protein
MTHAYAHDTLLGEQYSLLLSQFCQSRDALTYQQLVQVVAPRWTRLQEQYQCAWPYRMQYPSAPTPMGSPRSAHYEAWKRARCPRWFYFDHALHAQARVERDIESEPACRAFTSGPYPYGWVGYAPPHPIRFGPRLPAPRRRRHAMNVGRPSGYRPIPPLIGRGGPPGGGRGGGGGRGRP